MREYRTDIDGEEEWTDMGFKENLDHILHRERFDHLPTIEECREVPMIGGQEYDVQDDVRPSMMQQEIEAYKRFMERQEPHQTQEDDGPEWC